MKSEYNILNLEFPLSIIGNGHNKSSLDKTGALIIIC